MQTRRVRLSINGDEFEMAPETDVSALRAQFEAAVATPGRFVQVMTAGERQLSLLVTPVTRVWILVTDDDGPSMDASYMGVFPRDFEY